MIKRLQLSACILITLIAIFTIGSCKSTKSSDANIKISDPIFKAFLVENENINTNYDDEIQLSEAQAYSGDYYSWNQELLANWDSLDIQAPKVLDVSNLGISNLTGIEEFINLEGLICDNNNLKTLDLHKNEKLKIVSCSLNKLIKLDISNNTLVKNLVCNNNKLTKLDISANKNLLNLDCYNNKLKEIDITNNSKLTSIDCSHNPLNKLNIRNNSSLLSLNCTATELSSLNVNSNTDLTHLWCGENNLTTLDIRSNTALEQLDCHSNLLKSINIKNCPNLEKLSCGFNNAMVIYATEDQYNLYANSLNWITGDALITY
ncbi:MAG: hypothetical protein BKP49_00235 [Treponema sp. CETP13]|nr:MAG: hypothetical protein BKP49_00235 [Treponema sp. CETP13]